MTKLPCVLLVDDAPTTNFLNRKLLLRLGATDEVRVALNGRRWLSCTPAGTSKVLAPCSFSST